MKTKRPYEKPTVKAIVIMQRPLLSSASVKDWEDPQSQDWGGDGP